MKFIIFQKFNYNYIFFILYFIACLAIDFIELDTKKHAKIKHGRGHFNETISLFFLSLSDFLAFIPLKIKKYLSKRKNDDQILINNNEDKSSKRSSVYIYHNKVQDEKKKKMKVLNFYTFLAGLLDFVVNSLFFLYYSQNDYEDYNNLSYNLSFELSFQISMQYFLSIIILKEHFYKHHYLSIIINVIICFILLIIDIIEGFLELGLDLAYPIILLFLVLENAFGKKAMIFGYISPYTLLILIGIYKNILMFIFLVIYIPIMVNMNENYFVDVKEFDYVKILILLLNFVLNFLKSLFNWILIDRFSPSHLALSLIFENLSYIIVTIILFKEEYKDDLKNNAFQISIRIILYFILFIAAMIHNEIFIINKWDLGSKTKLFLEQKQEEENILSFSEDTEILRRYDTMVELEENANANNEGENN